ncbi:MAG: hypothetical protein ACUVWA_03170 [Candidatus Oleimicrobiaceae bacterium]
MASKRVSRFCVAFFGLVLVLMVGTSTKGAGQVPVEEPRVIVGLRGGQFRISLDRFENLYESRWGFCYGGDVALRVYGTLYALCGGRRFQMSGKSHEWAGGVPPRRARWNEKWLLLGIRRWSLGEGRWASAIGLGYAFFWVEEEPQAAVLIVPAGGAGAQTGKGFFLTVSVDYSLQPWLGITGELEVTSAGVGGRTGFEGSSIGGFFLSLGVSLRPF